MGPTLARLCRRCEKTYPLTAFQRNRHGHTHVCPACRGKARKVRATQQHGGKIVGAPEPPGQTWAREVSVKALVNQVRLGCTIADLLRLALHERDWTLVEAAQKCVDRLGTEG